MMTKYDRWLWLMVDNPTSTAKELAHTPSAPGDLDFFSQPGRSFHFALRHIGPKRAAKPATVTAFLSPAETMVMRRG